MRENPLAEQSFDFAKRIIKLCLHLRENGIDKVLTTQVLRSGTSVGANIAEAQGALSKQEFSHKMSIAYKEIKETMYWLRLLHETGFIGQTAYDSIHEDAQAISKMLFALLKSTGRVR
jgi:four helix bundle protein